MRSVLTYDVSGKRMRNKPKKTRMDLIKVYFRTLNANSVNVGSFRFNKSYFGIRMMLNESSSLTKKSNHR